MSSYKVAQDVEADDKLIGPFSFRQFIYLIVVAIAIGLAWGLSRVFVGLAIIPMPVIVFFGALALPLKKDQPMEVYLAAVLSYHLKSKKRIWQPDGVESLVEITAPKEVEVKRMKDLTENEAEKRLSYLAQIADTEGWAIRHTASVPDANTSMQSDIYYTAQATEDPLDTTSSVGHSFGEMIDAADQQRRDEMMARMQGAAQAQPVQQLVVEEPVQPAGPQDPYASLQEPRAPYAPVQELPELPNEAPVPTEVRYDPYPNMHQQTIQPIGNTPAKPPQVEQPSTSEKPVSPAIINLANSGMSVASIAAEAHRIEQKEQETDDDEVVISLR